MTETLKRTFGDGHSSAAISSSSSASSLENSLNGGYSYSSERSNFTSDIVVKQEPTFYQSDQQWVDKDSGDDEEDETLFYNGSYYRKTYKPTHFGSRGSHICADVYWVLAHSVTVFRYKILNNKSQISNKSQGKKFNIPNLTRTRR